MVCCGATNHALPEIINPLTLLRGHVRFFGGRATNPVDLKTRGSDVTLHISFTHTYIPPCSTHFFNSSPAGVLTQITDLDNFHLSVENSFNRRFCSSTIHHVRSHRSGARYNNPPTSIQMQRQTLALHSPQAGRLTTPPLVPYGFSSWFLFSFLSYINLEGCDEQFTNSFLNRIATTSKNLGIGQQSTYKAAEMKNLRSVTSTSATFTA